MPIDLIERAAERLKRRNDLDLVEKAAARVAAETAVLANGLAAAPEPANVEGPRQSRQVQIDITRLQMTGFVTPAGSRTRIAEEFRVIKRPLLLKAFAHGPDAIEHGNMIMVTSPNPREGKSFTAINLAMSIASERDLHVLLVDADVQRPSIMKTLGVPEHKGLLDVLSDNGVALSEAILRTNIRNLSLMPAGSPSLATTELLASQKMAMLMGDMAARYRDRVIIFDAPPVLASSEPSVLALHVGQIIVVIEAGRTGRRAVEETLNHISGCPNVNIVLNKTQLQNRTDRFGAYSYYGADRVVAADT
jgi:protein-tyrosine kinase